MEHSTALLNDLTHLASRIGLNAEVLQAPLRTLVGELRAAVHSYRGLQLTIVQHAQRITLTDLPHTDDDGSFVTSLRIPLSVLGPLYDAGSRIVFYAGVAGSLVDLAADLSYVLKTPTTTADDPERDGAVGDGEGRVVPAPNGSPALLLDADLPPNPPVSGLSGLSELSAVNRAVGIMIDRGHRPDRAYDTLRRQATDAGVETHVYAAQVFGRWLGEVSAGLLLSEAGDRSITMAETPPFAELLTLIDDRSAALRTAVASAPDLDARVPGCPDWTLRDLVAHLGEVQRSWAVGVQAGTAEGPPSYQAVGDRSPHGDLVEWSAKSTQQLIEALRAVGPDAPCWTWWDRSDAPNDSGAVARHQVEEAAVHAYDAQETVGHPQPLPAPIAVDGVAEFLVVSLGTAGPWSHAPARLVFAATEGPAWAVDLTADGAKVVPMDGGESTAIASATASDLLLALFSRVPLERLRIEGDRRVVEQLLDWVDTE